MAIAGVGLRGGLPGPSGQIPGRSPRAGLWSGSHLDPRAAAAFSSRSTLGPLGLCCGAAFLTTVTPPGHTSPVPWVVLGTASLAARCAPGTGLKTDADLA